MVSDGLINGLDVRVLDVRVIINGTDIHPVWFITDTSNFRLVCPLEFPYTVHATLLI